MRVYIYYIVYKAKPPQYRCIPILKHICIDVLSYCHISIFSYFCITTKPHHLLRQCGDIVAFRYSI